MSLKTTERALYEKRLEVAQARLIKRIRALTMAVDDPGDSAGYSTLMRGGVEATAAGQKSAQQAVARLLNQTLNAAGQIDDAHDLISAASVPVQRSASGIQSLLGSTQRIIGQRMAGGASFPEAREGSANALGRILGSEPHRVARDGTLAIGSTDSRFDRFQRIPEPGACTFCGMLATRGAIYLTAESAGQGRKYHFSCKCHIELVVGASAVKKSIDEGAAKWEKMDIGGKRNRRGWQPVDRAASVDQQLKVLRRQVDDGTATQWTRDRIEALELERKQWATPKPSGPRLDSQSQREFLTERGVDNSLYDSFGAGDDQYDALVGQSDLIETPDQRAFYDYLSGGYDDMNRTLRGTHTPSARLKEEITQLRDTIAEATPTDADMIVYRGINGPSLVPELGLDRRFVEPGFMSTTADLTMAEDFAIGTETLADLGTSIEDAGVILKINVPAGTQAIGGAITESEVLLQSGTTLRILDEAESYELDEVMVRVWNAEVVTP